MLRKAAGCLALLLAVSAGAAGKRVITGARLQRFTAPGSMGRVTDTIYIRCFWPASELPFEPFAVGSSGIEVEGPPTPRNILFPADTVFHRGTRGDCFHEKDSTILDPVTMSPPDDNPLQRKEITRTRAVQIKRTDPLPGGTVTADKAGQ